MVQSAELQTFMEMARKAGAQVARLRTFAEAGEYICPLVDGELFVADFASARRTDLPSSLKKAGCRVASGFGRETAAKVAAGVTGANFAIADTGTLVLESTPEDIRLASTLPERHFALADTRKIVADGLAAIPYVRGFHRDTAPSYLAYITGPSRTADIERVLTIGVHGPRELHILLVDDLSSDFLEM